MSTGFHSNPTIVRRPDGAGAVKLCRVGGSGQSRRRRPAANTDDWPSKPTKCSRPNVDGAAARDSRARRARPRSGAFRQTAGACVGDEDPRRQRQRRATLDQRRVAHLSGALGSGPRPLPARRSPAGGFPLSWSSARVASSSRRPSNQASRRRSGPGVTPGGCSGRGRLRRGGGAVGVRALKRGRGPAGASESFTTVIVRSRYRRHPRLGPGSG